jgi:hypothetical protein
LSGFAQDIQLLLIDRCKPGVRFFYGRVAWISAPLVFYGVGFSIGYAGKADTFVFPSVSDLLYFGNMLFSIVEAFL